VASTQYGWFVATRIMEDRHRSDIPEELPGLMAYARKQDCAYILFDCDGPEHPDLRRFPW
jgi:hypothetical protein